MGTAYYTVGYKWVTVLKGIKFEFNDSMIIVYKKTILSRIGLSA